MNIVVFGATGNIGSAVVERLADAEAVEAVRAVARRVPEPAPGFPGSGKVTWSAADLRHDDLSRVVDGAAAVVQLGWMFQPTHRPSVTWETNVVGMARLLDAVQEAGVPAVVAASSVAAYSARRDLDPVDESWPTHGTSTAAYCREKAYVERLLDGFAARATGCRVVRVRPAFVFQHRAAAEQRRIFAGPLVRGFMVRPGTVPVLPAPRDLRLQTVHATDVADAVARCVLRDVEGAFNVCADDVLAPRDIAGLLDARHVPVAPSVARTVLAAAWSVRAVPADPWLFDAVMRIPVMSNQRARRELGWQPTRTGRDAVAEFLVGLREGAGHPTPPLHPDPDGVG